MDEYFIPIEKLANIRLPLDPGSRIFVSGTLGSGKTTLIRHLLTERLGITGPVPSPTYTYYAHYEPHVYHFDLYRLSGYAGFVEIAGEQIWEDPGAICLVEWSDRLQGQLAPTATIDIGMIPDRPDLRRYRVVLSQTDRLDAGTVEPGDLDV